MKVITINSFEDFVDKVAKIGNLGNGIVLFRGQSDDKPLLPSIF